MKTLRHITILLLAAAIGVLAGDARTAGKEPARVLRVCADPANLPMSNQEGQGYENRVAALVARELHAELAYTWWAQRRGFFRNTLNAGTCDVVMAVPSGLDMARTTRPYFRSTFAFVTRRSDSMDDLRSIDDPRLRTMRIGVPLAGDDGGNPAPVHALARRGIVDGLVGFSLWGEYRRELPSAVEALQRGEVDVAILWGPVAGWGAKRSAVPLNVVPVEEERDERVPFAFSMSMAVRRKDVALARELDAVIERAGMQLTNILHDAGVPLLPLEPRP
ncbi:quinoprotein dehydrogenase-associated putative ABC transporter substrate-binding protein [Pendulispora brunnea]|uniref:Quinoprotein dehydrogenase-associated putative ABC transporter substrate-binding protein n=1 Tax=Pendulispora brunnea TaxID=2905690 RepID=A0ABZ2K9L8_9BACT